MNIWTIHQHNKKLRNIFKQHPNGVGSVKTKRIQWLGHVWKAKVSKMKEVLYK